MDVDRCNTSATLFIVCRLTGAVVLIKGSRDVIGHVTIRFLICYFLLVVLWNQASVFKVTDIFNGECDAKVGMTVNDL